MCSNRQINTFEGPRWGKIKNRKPKMENFALLFLQSNKYDHAISFRCFNFYLETLFVFDRSNNFEPFHHTCCVKLMRHTKTLPTLSLFAFLMEETRYFQRNQLFEFAVIAKKIFPGRGCVEKIK